MASESLDLIFVGATGLVAGLAVLGAWRGRVAGSVPRARSTGRRAWLVGVIALTTYTACRDAAVVTLMQRAGIEPWTFLFVDLACLVPYVIAAPRAARAAVEGNAPALLRWAPCFLYGAMVPVAYVALVFDQTPGPVTSLAAGYLALVLLVGAYGLLRRSGRLPAPDLNVIRTALVRRGAG